MLDLDDFLSNDEDGVDIDDRDFFIPDESKEDDNAAELAEEEKDEGEPGFDLENDPRFDENTEEDETPAEDPKVETPKVTPEIPVADTSLIESFLERYNIIGGELETETGTKVLFKDLTADQQLNALGQVVDSANEELSGLNVEEKKLLTSVRESKLSVQEYMTQSAREFTDLEAASQIYDVPEYQFETMDADVIYSTYVLSNNPDVTEEILQQEVDYAKKSPLYESTVTALRNSFIDQRELQRKEYTEILVTSRIKEAEKQSVKYIDAARVVDDIAGWPVKDDIKNELLESFVELDATGKSKFVRDIVDNPEMAFKAMWFLKYGEDNFKKIDTYYKDQLQRVYAKGIEDGKSGKSTGSTRQSGIREKTANEKVPGTVGQKMTLEEFMHTK